MLGGVRRLFERIRAGRWLQRDRTRSMRGKIAEFGSQYVVVQLGASEVVYLGDTLAELSRQCEAEDGSGVAMTPEWVAAFGGLRICALAMSLRTRGGLLPYRLDCEKDLQALAITPVRVLDEVLGIIAEDCGLRWLAPSALDAPEVDSKPKSAPLELSKESAENPS